MTDLASSVALFTGGTSGIGLACAEAFAAAGVAGIMLAGRAAERGAAATARLQAATPGLDVRFVSADVATPEGAQTACTACLDAFGRVDALVSTAGGSAIPTLFHELPLGVVSPTIDTIMSGVILPARAVLPQMMAQKSGAIICVASDAGKLATPGEVAIGAAMAGIVMFCRGLAIEAKRSSIRVNCLTPSIVRDTALYDVLMADPFAGKLFSKAEELANLGVVEPDDLAALAVFLASPAAAKLTGQAISVNGGISAA